ncbi:MAG: hypothetical protein EZS28_014124 [Streblomastix strix]|uniref:Par3/HAL N-terminal domain-containing protein n=1 Tax=Streblomastix strix TaxID=222440 RepID=A0A5J4W659_9EUKA|nr:MAG: hypothetical protein EZS28_014124 [Streblomastix strix]
MKVFVHVRHKVIQVQCGPATQKIRWLADVGVARFDSKNGVDLGVPKGIKRDNGEHLDMQALIRDFVQQDEHVWVCFKDDDQTISQ